ncbi:MAG: hypothetical protein J1F67_06035 [Muribaculaceae bacterium]|nr:hypothetical protein [Muribaculaceae bacterium]
MSFWKIAGEFAKEFGKGYVQERGVRGTVEDLGSLARGVKGFFSSDDDNDTTHPLAESYNEYINEGDYEGAIDFIKECYKGETKDYIYYYYLGNAYRQMGDTENLNLAINNLQQSYNTCPIGTEDSATIKEELESAKELKRYLDAWDNATENIERQTENRNFSGAVSALNAFYNKYDSGKKDFYYWKYLYDIHLEKEKAKSDYSSWNLGVLENDLNQMRHLAQDSHIESLEEKECDFEYRKYEWRKECFKEKGEYQLAKIEIEKHYATDPNKNYDFFYWNDLMNNQMAALLSNTVIGNNRNEDQAEAKRILNQMTLLSKTEEDTDLIELFEDIIKEFNETLETIPGSVNFTFDKEENDSTNQREASRKANDFEQEFIEELKLCYQDGIITDRERRILDRLRKSLGISEQRAQELEAQCNPNILTKDEEEYAEEVKAVLEDGVISERERRLLNKLAKSLNISSERAQEIEKKILNSI